MPLYNEDMPADIAHYGLPEGREMEPQNGPFRIVHTVCSHDCPDSCAVLVTVNAEGKAVRIQGDPSHPVTQGFLCGKVAKYLERVYSPGRVLYPLRRRAGVPKGKLEKGRESAAFERVSWDEALSEIASRLQAISQRYGPESILPYSYAGTIGLLGYGSMDRRFFHRLGASQLNRTICAEAGGVAWTLVYGRKLGTPNEDFPHARLIIAWGANIHGNNIHLWPFVEQARRSGARLIVIDPYRTRTAGLADWHIAIRPGTDVALAMGIMHVIFRNGLEDRAYIDQMTHGFEQLWQRVQSYTPEFVSAATGLTASDVERLAMEYATTTPAVIRMNYGVQRSQNGGTAVRAISMLPVIIGAWKQKGGGAQLSLSGAFKFAKAAVERPDLMNASPLGRNARVVNMSELGRAITELGSDPAEGPQVHAVFVYNSNPVAVAPNQNAVRRGFERDDLFTVVHEQFMTDTTDYADYVLPATTFLEHTDIQGAYGHYFLQQSDQAIAPPGEARSNVSLFSELAMRMDFTEECFRDSPEDMIRQALDLNENGHSRNPDMEHISPALLAEQGSIPLGFMNGKRRESYLPFCGTDYLPLPTPSGKIEFYSEALKAAGQDPLPAFHAPIESRKGPAARRFPLEFLPRKADNYMNSTFANLDGHRKMESKTNGRLEIHPTDASVRSIMDGDLVRVWNDRGSMTLIALVSDRVGEGVVAGRLDWNKMSVDGQNVNALTSERLTDLGGGATFYSVIVEVEKI